MLTFLLCVGVGPRSVLLCPWAALDCPCALQGSAVPEGETLYVLRVKKQTGLVVEEWLYNAVRGDEYNLDYDANILPLRSISALVSPFNVYANIQVCLFVCSPFYVCVRICPCA